MIIARIVKPSDARKLRALRLEALESYGDIMSRLSRRERLQSPLWWKKRATPSKDQCFFGLFDDKKMVGLMNAQRFVCGRAKQTVFWNGTYAQEAYRDQHHMQPLYQLRHAWSVRQGFRRAVFYILDQSERSRAIMLKQGATPTRRVHMRFAHGPRVIETWHRLSLR